jgi:hypothetical protein
MYIDTSIHTRDYIVLAIVMVAAIASLILPAHWYRSAVRFRNNLRKHVSVKYVPRPVSFQCLMYKCDECRFPVECHCRCHGDKHA